MKNALLLSLLFLNITLSAQSYDSRTIIIRDEWRFLSYGDALYPIDFRGVESFMTDLRFSDPALYNQMEGRFLNMRDRRATAHVVMFGGGALGLGLIFGSMVASFNSDFETGPKRAATGLIFGALIAGAAPLIAGGIYRSDRELLGFLNAFNARSDGLKLRLTAGLDETGGGLYGGVGLAVPLR